MLRAEHLTVELGGRVVLRDLSLLAQPRAPIAVVGPNGAGKSTLLRALAGELRPDAGKVELPPGARIGYLPQGAAGREHLPVAEAFPALFGGASLEHEVAALAAALVRDPDDAALAGAYDDALARLASLPPTAVVDAWRADLDLGPLDPAATLGQLSGGELTKLGLVALAAAKPDVLLLDEPTNNLDLHGIAWLEAFIRGFRGPVVFVSHDRALIDACASHTLELQASGDHELFAGGYSDYAAEKARREAGLWEQYLRQQREERRLRQVISGIESRSRHIENRTIDFYVRKRAAKVARRAVTLKARLERQAESAGHVDRPDTAMRGFEGSFATSDGAASRLVSAIDATVAIGGRPLLRHLSFDVRRGERVAMTGPNGCGKTTLLRTLLGEVPASGGMLTLAGSAITGYLPQAEPGPDSNGEAHLTAVDLLRRARPMTETEASNVLHRFFLGHTQLRTPLAALSYGERRRLSLAVLVLGGANLLLLDEPTNHLDLPSREAFEAALSGYDGTVVAITHDRHFIERFATRVIDLEPFAVPRNERK